MKTGFFIAAGVILLAAAVPTAAAVGVHEACIYRVDTDDNQFTTCAFVWTGSCMRVGEQWQNPSRSQATYVEWCPLRTYY